MLMATEAWKVSHGKPKKKWKMKKRGKQEPVETKSDPMFSTDGNFLFCPFSWSWDSDEKKGQWCKKNDITISCRNSRVSPSLKEEKKKPAEYLMNWMYKVNFQEH